MTQRRILVVDDDQIVLQSCTRILESAGHVVVCAPGAGEALENLERGRFDLMIMDIKMPEHDGFYLLERIREKWSPERFPELPVLVMTGYPTQETLRDLKCWVRRFIPKPFTPDELLTAVEDLVGRKEADEE